MVVNSSDGSDGTINGATTNAAGVVTNGAQTFGGNKTFDDDVIVKGDLTVEGDINVSNVNVIETSNGIIFEGITANAHKTTLKAEDPTAERIIKLPDAGGTVALTSQIPKVNNGTLTISNGGGITGSGTFTANQSGNTPITISHADTSSQTSMTTGGRTYINSISLDDYGHVTALGTGTETVTNTITNISITHNAASVVVNSSDGTDGTINGATPNAAGVVTTGTQTFVGGKTFENTLSVTGNFAINTNKFNVTATSGNTKIAGDLEVSGGNGIKIKESSLVWDSVSESLKFIFT